MLNEACCKHPNVSTQSGDEGSSEDVGMGEGKRQRESPGWSNHEQPTVSGGEGIGQGACSSSFRAAEMPGWAIRSSSFACSLRSQRCRHPDGGVPARVGVRGEW